MRLSSNRLARRFTTKKAAAHSNDSAKRAGIVRTCIVSVLRVRQALLITCNLIRTDLEEKCPPALSIDRQFFNDCLRTEKILRPLCKASLKMQAEDANLADVVACFVLMYDAFNELDIGSGNDAQQKKIDILQHMSKRWNDLEHPLFLRTFMLHPVHVTAFKRMDS